MPIEGPDGFGKLIGGVAAVKPREDDPDCFPDDGEVSSYVRKRVDDFNSGRPDDILIDDVAGPATLPSRKIVAEGLPMVRFISDFREVGERDIESEIRELADIYNAIYSAANENEGMKTAHKLFMESLYPSDNLPLMEAVSTYLDEDGSAKNLQLILAVDGFADAMRTVKLIAERESISYYDAFLDAYGDSLSARNNLVGQMVRAKKEAYECINQNRRLIKDIDLAQRADDLIMKYEELENGLEFNPDFIAKLEDPSTKAVVISLDFNSTFNSKESYPAMELVARVQRELSAFAPVAEIREVAVGESGGGDFGGGAEYGEDEGGGGESGGVEVGTGKS